MAVGCHERHDDGVDAELHARVARDPCGLEPASRIRGVGLDGTERVAGRDHADPVTEWAVEAIERGEPMVPLAVLVGGWVASIAGTVTLGGTVGGGVPAMVAGAPVTESKRGPAASSARTRFRRTPV